MYDPHRVQCRDNKAAQAGVNEDHGQIAEEMPTYCEDSRPPKGDLYERAA